MRSPVLNLLHIVWATSRRRPVLPRAFDEQLAAMVGASSRKLRSELLVFGCAAEHVHVIIRLAPTATLADLVQRLKGASAFHANQRRLLPGRLEWQQGYWAESVGAAELDPLSIYVRGQRETHDASHPAERWQFGDDQKSPPQAGFE